MKTLYFEGAGMEGTNRGDVENCRIRTAFHDDCNNKIYLEISSMEITKHSNKAYFMFANVSFVTDCFYILGDDDANKHSIVGRNNKHFESSKKNILDFVNSLGCSFDSVVILPDLAGYRVFLDHNGSKSVLWQTYSYGDEFVFDEKKTEMAEGIKQHYYNLEKSEGKQYPNFSLWVDQDNKNNLHLLRHFNGYNKHWLIDIFEGWESAMEAKLGSCAC